MKHSSLDVRRFVEALSREMVRHCGPVFITPGLNTYPEAMIDTGTFGLIDTGKRHVLVTSHHVWKRFEIERSINPAAVLALALSDQDGCISFKRPDAQILDADEELDLIVFDFAPEDIRVNREPVVHTKTWFPIRNWPIQEAVKGETLVIMGFPGKLVTKAGMNCTFRHFPIPLVVSDVSPRNIVLFNTEENQEVFNDISSVLGGLSGSPAYALAESGAKLVGFVKSGREVSEGDDRQISSIFAGCLFLTPASILNPDGTIRRDAL